MSLCSCVTEDDLLVGGFVLVAISVMIAYLCTMSLNRNLEELKQLLQNPLAAPAYVAEPDRI